MGKQQSEPKQERLWYRGEIAEAPGHPFYQRMNRLLAEAKFDEFCERECQQYYHAKMGRPSLAPGIYFRMMLIGFFEGLESDRGIAWRVADSLSLRSFLRLDIDDRTPDHSTLSKTRRLISEESHLAVFKWVLHELAQRGLLKGKTIGIDATTLEANAAMRSIRHRESGLSYQDFLKTLAKDGEQDADSLKRMDRKRRKKVTNNEWVNPQAPQAEITKLKTGQTRLAFKVEQAVDLETGAIVAVTTHGGATGDTTSIEETLPAAGEMIAEEIATPTSDGKYGVNQGSIEEVVTDKGYHSNKILAAVNEMGVRSYISEPDRGRRNWKGKEDQKDLVYANRRRMNGDRGKSLVRQRAEKVERPFAHLFARGKMRRLHVRGLQNVRKRCLLLAAAFNLALLTRSICGSGTPRELSDRQIKLFSAILRFMARISA